MKTDLIAIEAAAPRRPLPHRRLPLAVSVAVALTALFGCASSGPEKQSWRDSGHEPQIRPLPLTITGKPTAAAYYALGRQEYLDGRYAEAEAAYRQALQVSPDAVEPLNGLAVLHDRLGRFDLAAAEYQAALAKTPNAPHILANLGYSLLLQGRAEEALAPLQRSLQLAPENRITRANLARAEAAAALAKTHAEPGHEAPVAAAAPSAPAPAASVAATAAATATAEAASAPATDAAPTAAEEAAPARDATAAPEASVDIAATTSAPSATSAEPTPVAAPDEALPSVRLIPPTTLLGAANVTAPAAEPVRHGIILSVIGTSDAPLDTSGGSAYLAMPMIASVQGAEMRTPAPLGEMFSGMRIEVANGNGVTGMARAMRTRLGAEGVRVTRVTNAKPYDKRRTLIVCTEARQPQAAALAKELAVSPRFIVASTQHRNVDLRLVLGADLIGSPANPLAGRKLAQLGE